MNVWRNIESTIWSLVSFKYDPFGRRIYKSSSSATSVYAYDGDNLIEEANATGGVVARYEQTQNIDEPMAMLRSSTTSYYHADGLGSVTSLSNGAGSIANTYTYDSFGKLTASTGSLVNPFQYTGRESDSETGLYYYRARYYDSTLGSFISEDPIGFDSGDVGLYAYVNGDPLNYTDPVGLNKYHCDLLGHCYKLPSHPNRRPSHSRSADFLNINVAIGPIVGLDCSFSLDKTGHFYFGVGVQAGKSPFFVGASATGNWLDQYNAPTPFQLNQYLTNKNVTGGAFFGVGVQQGCWRKSGCATGPGYGTPQIGGSFTNSWDLGKIPGAGWHD